MVRKVISFFQEKKKVDLFILGSDMKAWLEEQWRLQNLYSHSDRIEKKNLILSSYSFSHQVRRSDFRSQYGIHSTYSFLYGPFCSTFQELKWGCDSKYVALNI